MTTDRQLLEDAARALGAQWRWYDAPMGQLFQIMLPDQTLWSFWNPATSYGDAMQLAASLRLLVDFNQGEVIGPWEVWNFEPGDGLGACLAITRAAAEIGKHMREAGNG